MKQDKIIEIRRNAHYWEYRFSESLWKSTLYLITCPMAKLKMDILHFFPEYKISLTIHNSQLTKGVRNG